MTLKPVAVGPGQCSATLADRQDAALSSEGAGSAERATTAVSSLWSMQTAMTLPPGLFAEKTVASMIIGLGGIRALELRPVK